MLNDLSDAGGDRIPAPYLIRGRLFAGMTEVVDLGPHEV